MHLSLGESGETLSSLGQFLWFIPAWNIDGGGRASSLPILARLRRLNPPRALSAPPRAWPVVNHERGIIYYECRPISKRLFLCVCVRAERIFHKGGRRAARNRVSINVNSQQRAIICIVPREILCGYKLHAYYLHLPGKFNPQTTILKAPYL